VNDCRENGSARTAYPCCREKLKAPNRGADQRTIVEQLQDAQKDNCRPPILHVAIVARPRFGSSSRISAIVPPESIAQESRPLIVGLFLSTLLTVRKLRV
jgi:hypothetical protein